MSEPLDIPAHVYDAIARELGHWPHEVTPDDHEAGAWLEHAIGAVVLTNQRFVTREGYLLLKGRPLRRVGGV